MQATSTPVLEYTALRTTANAPLKRMVEDNTSSPKCLSTGKLAVGFAKTGTTLRTDGILISRLPIGDLLSVGLSENPPFLDEAQTIFPEFFGVRPSAEVRCETAFLITTTNGSLGAEAAVVFVTNG